MAIISPNRKALEELVARLADHHPALAKSPLAVQIEDDEVTAEVYESIVATAKAAGLVKKEIPVRIKVVAEAWSPDNGILTAALKLKRKTIESTYKRTIEQLYDTKTSQRKQKNNGHSYDQNNNSVANSQRNKSVNANGGTKTNSNGSTQINIPPV